MSCGTMKLRQIAKGKVCSTCVIAMLSSHMAFVYMWSTHKSPCGWDHVDCLFRMTKVLKSQSISEGVLVYSLGKA